MFEDFVTEEEETELLAYWSPGGPVYEQGAKEARTQRRFFHYGPALALKSDRSTKSTLAVVPCQLGAMPPLVARLALQARTRAKATGLGDRLLSLDQLYVNHYAAQDRARIDFHHDHPRSMKGVVAGVSLGAAGEFRLGALDPELAPQGAGVAAAAATAAVALVAQVPLPRRSLYLLSGLSRYHLQHAVPKVRQDRLSLTFRSVALDSEDRALWRRAWAHLPREEAANAHWPLLPPAGA